MSDPFFFAFNVTQEKMVLAHAVIFTSFFVSEGCPMNIADASDDPRMIQFIQYAIENYGKKAKKALEETIREKAEELDKLHVSIKNLKQELHRLGRL